MTEVDILAEKIESMKVRGARDIAIAAAEALLELSEAGVGVEEMQAAGEKLKAARPSAISLPNAVDYCLYLAEKNKDPEKTTQEIGAFLKSLNQSIEKITEIGAEVVEDGDVILTHCQSDTVVQILKRAWDDGKKISAVCTEARPRHQGRITAAMLSEHGIPTTLIIDSAVHHMMRKLKVSKVIVGADTVAVNGDVINKIGSSQIALSAKDRGIPFYVAAESLKFDPRSLLGHHVRIEERDPSEVTEPLPGVTIINPAFDITESELIEAIITEEGMIPPAAAYQILKDKYGWEIKK